MNSLVQQQPSKLPIIIAGAGPVGIRFAEEILKLAPTQPLKLFSGEAFKPYDRVKLSLLLAHDISEADIYSVFAPPPNCRIFDNCPVVAINRDEQCVQDANGIWHQYDKLILALGSSAFIPSIPYVDCKNVYTFRDLKDTQALAARNLSSRHTIVIGGGLLGLETARAMQRNNTRVTIVQMAGHLMNQQLDRAAGDLLKEKVSALGIEVICSRRAASIIPNEIDFNAPHPRVGGVRLDDGRMLACDTVIISAGIKPRIELALQHGLKVARGIRVNEHMQSSDPNIYAIGECAQFGEQIYGLVAPGWEHAAIAAHHIMGEDAIYKGTINAAALKVVGEDVFSVGEVNLDVNPSLLKTVYQDHTRGQYRAVFTLNKRMVGALAIGQWPEQARLQASIIAGRKLQAWHLWTFKREGQLWAGSASNDISNWPAGMVVCNCTGVTRAQLSSAYKDGATTVQALAQCTRASTVCGSCKPLLNTLCGTQAESAPQRPVWTGRISILAGLLLLLLLFTGPLPYSVSVQNFAPDVLWTDSLFKQISGFSLLGLAALSLLMSLSKRWKKFKLGSFISWRIAHLSLGTTAIAVLLAHTGIQLGVHLNRALMINFLLLLLAGVIAGVVISKENWFSVKTARSLRSSLTWAHTLLFWPLPVLLGFHILSVYYF